MIVDVDIPNQGLTITEATLVRWTKEVGDRVAADELLFEYETDKALVEVQSPSAGRLLARLATEGEIVPLGRTIAKIGTDDSDTYRPDSSDQAEPTEPAPQHNPLTTGTDSRLQPFAAGQADERLEVSPRARRVADELGIDLKMVTPTGRRGRHVRERDVLAAAALNAQAGIPKGVVIDPLRSNECAARPSEMTRLRSLTARQTERSFRDVPHFYLTREINAERLMAVRTELLDSAASHTPTRVSVTDFILRALTLALTKYPNVNAQWRDGGIEQLESVNIGLAVSTPDGLIVPVLRDLARHNLFAIASARIALVERARNGKSLPTDLQDGSFTLTNLGRYDVDQFDPIINTPESGILAAGSIKQRPYVVGGKVRAINTLVATVAIDHRVVDGDVAAQFLGLICDLLESPVALCAL